jgi:hypothetical protein
MRVETNVGFCVICLLLLIGFNQNWNISTGFIKTLHIIYHTYCGEVLELLYASRWRSRGKHDETMRHIFTHFFFRLCHRKKPSLKATATVPLHIRKS